MALPRITGRQMQRSNVPSATPEEYYRRNVYLPLLADFENQLRDRFDAHKKPTFYPGDFTRVDVDPGTDFFHTEKAEELPSKSYEQRQMTGLALLSIHRELQVTPEQSLDVICVRNVGVLPEFHRVVWSVWSSGGGGSCDAKPRLPRAEDAAESFWRAQPASLPYWLSEAARSLGDMNASIYAVLLASTCCWAAAQAKRALAEEAWWLSQYKFGQATTLNVPI
ncbi:hypothetical protein HPB52_020385 [Rhipicephalus sanguineus]|uniref:Uncharacterized protein n=1 Tax=Rhipicephalus sanguineus TaxID=34632 RepID=A0A9D4Q2F8_RHISA|nr:hypothetical protein HPB52_020385 [Rhipicephalus sanguineus]